MSLNVLSGGSLLSGNCEDLVNYVSKLPRDVIWNVKSPWQYFLTLLHGVYRERVVNSGDNIE